MGNMQGESGFSPARFEDSFKSSWDNGTYDWENDPAQSRGVGLIQWSFERRTNLFKFLREKNSALVDEYLKKPNTYAAYGGDDFIAHARSEAEADALYSLELGYLIDEMKGNSSYNQVFSENTAEGAAVSFAVNVEGCSTCTVGSENTRARTENAQRIFTAYSGKTSFGSGVTAAETSANVGGDKITWIGDSYSEASAEKIKSAFSGVDLHALYSKKFKTDGGATTGGTSGLNILKNEVGSNLRDVLVFALGTNRDAGSKSAFASQIDELITTATGLNQNVKIVLVYPRTRTTDYTDYTEAMTEAASSHNNVVLADWSAVSKDHLDEYFDGRCNIGDGYQDNCVHPNDKGYDVWLDTIKSAISGSGTSTASSSSSSSNCSCGNSSVSADGVWASQKYALSDAQINGLLSIIYGENSGTLHAIQFQASIMANLFEFERPNAARTPEGLVDYVKNSGWFKDASSVYNESFTGYSQEALKAVQGVWRNGNRTIPPQIVEHDDLIGDIDYIEINGTRYENGSDGFKDLNNYVSGKTIIHQDPSRFPDGGTQWIFYAWANPDGTVISSSSDGNGTGDPFGYFENNPPANTNASAASAKNTNITFDAEGWITGGIDGYTKESAIGMSGLDSSANQDFNTEMPNGKGKGPNKITLHSTEGPNGGGISGLQFFESSGVPPHFTIDVKEKHVFQHFPIYKTAAAVASHDDTAGVQIEIIGYSDAALATSRGQSDWILSNFSDEEVKYLAQLLVGIGNATGIPMTSSADWSGGNNPVRMTDPIEFQKYTGILGHRHVPNNNHWDPDGIWDKLKTALGTVGGSAVGECSTVPLATGDVNALQNLVLRWAWPEYHSASYVTKKPEYDADIKKSKYTGDTCYGGGVDCGGFVYSLVTLSGWDPDFPLGPTHDMLASLQSSTTWQEVTSQIHSNSDASPGDVIIKDGHVLIYVGKINGFGGEMASASQCERAPMADHAEDISNYTQNPEYHIFRKVK